MKRTRKRKSRALAWATSRKFMAMGSEFDFDPTYARHPEELWTVTPQIINPLCGIRLVRDEVPT